MHATKSAALTCFIPNHMMMCQRGTTNCLQLSDNVGNKLVLKLAYPVFQPKLFSFQSRDLQLVSDWLFLQSGNGVIKVAVFDLQHFKLLPDPIIIHNYVTPTRKPDAHP
jgi:hypothetical protein